MIENNVFNISTNDVSKNNIKNKNKSNKSLNKIYSNINNNSNRQENTINNSNIPHEKILVIDLDETLIHTSFQKIPNPDFKIQIDSLKYTQKNSDAENIQALSIKNKVEAYIRIRPGSAGVGLDALRLLRRVHAQGDVRRERHGGST